MLESSVWGDLLLCYQLTLFPEKQLLFPEEAKYLKHVPNLRKTNDRKKIREAGTFFSKRSLFLDSRGNTLLLPCIACGSDGGLIFYLSRGCKVSKRR